MKWLVVFAAMTVAAAGQIPGNPRFHRGDDRRWADPAFDDRSWDRVADRMALRLDELKTNRQWIRMDVDIPPGGAALVSSLCSCEFYLNGIRIGATGDLDAALPEVNPVLSAFPIPDSIPPGPALLAIREYWPPGSEIGVSYMILAKTRVRMVPVSAIATNVLRMRAGAERQVVPIVALLIVLTLVIASMASNRIDNIALIICAYAVLHIVVIALARGGSSRLESVALWLVGTPTTPLVLGAMALGAGIAIRRIWTIVYLACHCLVRLPWAADQLRADPASWTPLLSGMYLALHPVGIAIGFIIAAIGWRKANSPRLFLLSGLATLCLTFVGRFAVGSGGIPIAGFVLTWDRSANIAFAVLGAMYVIRKERARRAEELRLKGELEAAQSVQALLLGQKLPEGVEAVYVPASEVGGDFYQVLEREGGSVMVVAGDVSGKGLKAAMLVAVALGALRREKSSSPGVVLEGLNDALGQHAHGGFVTCCCARFDADGGVRIANAGHPLPYRNGEELPLASGLPLGVVQGISYEETTLRLGSGEQVTFVSDGVVEATDPKGQLFGFERTRAVSGKSATAIAESARAWGQTDDITVVTVRRVG